MKKSTKRLIAAGAVAGAAAALCAAAVENLVSYTSRRHGRAYERAAERRKERREEDRPDAAALREAREWLRSQPLEQVQITSVDGLRLEGHFLQHPEAKRAAVLMHGWRDRWDTNLGAMARALYAQGTSVLLAEQRACGASEGSYIGFGVLERFDCQRWAEYLAERLGPEMPLYLGGVSMGASTVLMAAALPLPASVHGLIADCGFTSPRAILASVLRARTHLPERPLLPLASRVSRRRAGFGYEECSTIDALRGSRIPVLFLHGDADTFVPLAMTLENYLACAAPKELLIVEGAAHARSFYQDPAACAGALERFFARFDEAGAN